MKDKMKLGILCVCIVLSAAGCNSHREEQAEIDTINYDRTDEEALDETDLARADAEASDENAVSTEVTGSSQEEQRQQVQQDMQTNRDESEAENQALSEDDEKTADVTAGSQDLVDLPLCYQELINDAKECLEGNDVKEPEDYDFSQIIYMYSSLEDEWKEGLGYLIEDIDGNGTEELIFGENGTGAWEGVVYDLYSIDDGELVHVFSGGTRSSNYWFCGEGVIANELFDAYNIFGYRYYIFEGAELHLVEAVLYNGQESPENPWFYSTTKADDCYDLENAEPVTQEQARAVIDKYVYENRTYIPFMEN